MNTPVLTFVTNRRYKINQSANPKFMTVTKFQSFVLSPEHKQKSVDSFKSALAKARSQLRTTYCRTYASKWMTSDVSIQIQIQNKQETKTNNTSNKGNAFLLQQACCTNNLVTGTILGVLNVHLKCVLEKKTTI